MAHTHGYAYDIFISYAHNDNALVAGDAGWVTQFHERLKNWLQKSRGLRELSIWFDSEGLQGNTDFNAEIQQCINQSALFFVLHSENYRRSDYCRKELDWFLEHNHHYRNGVMAGNQSRLFNILINDIPFDTWNKPLAGTSGFPLHQQSGGFCDPSDPSSNEFTKQMQKLVDATTATLEIIAEQTPKPDQHTAQNTESSGHAQPTVFLATTSDTLQSFRKRLETEIGDRATLLPSLPPPYDAPSHQKQLTETLENASLSIHLLDQYPGLVMHDLDDMTFPRLQASAVRHRKQPSLVWVPDTLKPEDVEDATHARWLDEMENGERVSSGFHFIRSSQQSFIDQVKQLLDELEQQNTTENPMARFLIDTHQKDQRAAYRLADILADNDLDVEFNKESNNPVKSLENFEKMVLDVQHLIVMFGKVAPNWVKGRVQTAIKCASSQFDNNPLEAIWIFMLPDSKAHGSLQLPRLFQINQLENSCDKDIDRQVVEALLNYRKGGQ